MPSAGVNRCCWKKSSRTDALKKDFPSADLAFAYRDQPLSGNVINGLGVMGWGEGGNFLDLVPDQTSTELEGGAIEKFSSRQPRSLSRFRDVHGEGLLVVPDGREPVANVIAIPDADTLPEHIVGLVDGVPRASQFARRLAESGCRVIDSLYAAADETSRRQCAALFSFAAAISRSRNLSTHATPRNEATRSGGRHRIRARGGSGQVSARRNRRGETKESRVLATGRLVGGSVQRVDRPQSRTSLPHHGRARHAT